MQFNPAAIEFKQTDLDKILKREDLLRSVMEKNFGPECRWRVIPRQWEPGGGSTLFVVEANGVRALVKAKTKRMLVESKLECEPQYSPKPALLNECEILNSIDAPWRARVLFYEEAEDFGFLAQEYLDSFLDYLEKAGCVQLLNCWDRLEAAVRQLFDLGLVHTDIHERNICMRGDQPVLIDFEEAKRLKQDLPFEQSLDVAGRNILGDVGMFPSGHGIDGLTCLNRLRELFKVQLKRKLPELLAECKFDQECPFNLDALQKPDERIYQSVRLKGLAIEGQRNQRDTRPKLLAQLLRMAHGQLGRQVRHVDIGSNLGVFCIAAAKMREVEISIGLEAFEAYVWAARTLAFILDAERSRFERFICGDDDLAKAVGSVDCMSILSVYHHIANKERFLEQVAALDPALVWVEMATQARFYPERGSMQAEIAHIAKRLAFPHMETIAYTQDYQRPMFLFSKRPLSSFERFSARLVFMRGAGLAHAGRTILGWTQQQWAERVTRRREKLSKTVESFLKPFKPKGRARSGAGGIRLYDRYCKAMKWLNANRIEDEGVRITNRKAESYPEVTGYFIPTLMSWGEHALASQWADWLLAIQRSDGAWNGAGCNTAYTFDTGQILKGLLAIEPRMPQVRKAVERGCDWLLTQIDAGGAMRTPDTSEWKLPEGRMVPEAIHLYCLEPMMQASQRYGQARWREAAERVLAHYLAQPGLTQFETLSHFHAYILEALIDLGRADRAREGMAELERLQREDKSAPAYRNADWVCSTGLFQYAVIWYKLGEKALADAAFAQACALQNESGGFYGGYGTGANYFPDSEISWAVKYFLDGLRLHIMADFDADASSFPESMDADDGRYKLVRDAVKAAPPKSILELGCGKGRLLSLLNAEFPQASLTGLDMSAQMLASLPRGIEGIQGSMLDIPAADGQFDFAFSVEALEHAVAIEQAIKEMVRVVAPGGYLVIVDKNRDQLGALQISDWEQWFAADEVAAMLERAGCETRIERNVPYSGKSGADGLFLGWIARKRPV